MKLQVLKSSILNSLDLLRRIQMPRYLLGLMMCLNLSVGLLKHLRELPSARASIKMTWVLIQVLSHLIWMFKRPLISYLNSVWWPNQKEANLNHQEENLNMEPDHKQEYQTVLKWAKTIKNKIKIEGFFSSLMGSVNNNSKLIKGYYY